jgi:uncharacterized protein with HEPN domain
MPHNSDPLKYLADMRDRAVFVVEILQDKTVADLSQNRILRSCVERELSIVGEALYQMHKIRPEVAERIDNWRAIVRFRHILVHGYAAVDLNMMWEVTRDDLTPLITQLDSLLME